MGLEPVGQPRLGSEGIELGLIRQTIGGIGGETPLLVFLPP